MNKKTKIIISIIFVLEMIVLILLEPHLVDKTELHLNEAATQKIPLYYNLQDKLNKYTNDKFPIYTRNESGDFVKITNK